MGHEQVIAETSLLEDLGAVRRDQKAARIEREDIRTRPFPGVFGWLRRAHELHQSGKHIDDLARTERTVNGDYL